MGIYIVIIMVTEIEFLNSNLDDRQHFLVQGPRGVRRSACDHDDDDCAVRTTTKN